MAAARFLVLEELSCRFGGLLAVDSVSAEIAQGRLVGIIGPNGAGKTTLFNLISGFTRPSGGRVTFKEHDITGLRGHRVARLGIARTFQNLRTVAEMTVFDNVSIGAVGALGLAPWSGAFGLGGRGWANRVSELTWQALERTHLAAHADQLAGRLPYGRRKYLEIARALALRPEVLILDEPAAGLNEGETAELADLIRSLHAGGLTILLVEHDMPLVMGICEQVIVLASGRKLADDTPAAVQHDPAVLEAYLGTDEE